VSGGCLPGLGLGWDLWPGFGLPSFLPLGWGGEVAGFGSEAGGELGEAVEA
jgi:hypothetical protein